MAITGTFLANFDQFVGEVKRADTALHGMGTSATRVTTEAESSFTRMGNTMRSLAGTFGIALSAGALIQFGRSVIDTASNIHDMGLKLGISSEAVQGFKFAAEQAGSSIETVGTAITRMNVNLSEGGKGTVAALKAAGLEFANIRSMKPEDAFLAITDAIQRIPDPMTRSEVALQLFGRSAADLLPAIQEGFRAAAEAAGKMSNDTIASLERAQDAWEKVANQVTIVSGTMLATFSEVVSRLKARWDELSTVQKVLQFGIGVTATLMTAWAEATGVVSGAAKKLETDIQLLPPVLHKTADELVVGEKALKANADATDKVTAAVKRMIDSQKTYIDMIVPGIKEITGLEQHRATGALAIHLAEQTAIREQQEALALVEQQTKDNFVVVGEYAAANKMAGEAAKAATHEAVMGYAAVGQQVTMTGDAIRAYIELQKYSAAANAILQENTLFTSRSQLERISKLPMGGGGGATTVHVNVSGVMDARTQDELGRVVSQHLTRTAMQGTKFS